MAARAGGGGVAIRRGGSDRADLTLRLVVSTLSRLFIGALPATAALDAGLLECDAPARLSALDPRSRRRSISSR